MRIIKFRQFCSDEDHHEYGMNYYDMYHGAVLDGYWSDPMQFTGLLDRNGKEIYEGDIYQVAKNRIYEVVFSLEGEYGEIHCGFGLRSVGIPDFILDTFAIKNGEVIGNVYEHKHLLEKP